VLEGDARETILRAAEEWPADLIVLGARGLGAMAGFLLGSVSLGVARHARCSVLVVKPGAGVIRRILIAIDGSEHAAAAAAFVAKLRLDPTMAVQLAGVVQSPPYPATTPAFATGMVRDALAQILKERTAALEQALAKAASPFAGLVKKVERQVFVESGGVLQVAPAPRFSETPGAIQWPPSDRTWTADDILAGWSTPRP